MFSSKMLIALFYIFGSVIHFELIFVYGIRKESNFIFFACRYPVVLAPFVEKTVLSPLNCLASFV